VSQNEIKLERPLLYNNPFGLRFEIGPAQIGVWADRTARKLNEKYFETALKRAQDIFEAAFSSEDDISIAYQLFSDGRRRIKKNCYILRQIDNGIISKTTYSDHRELYSEDLDYKCQCWRRVTVSDLKTKDANIKNILISIINTDFGTRQPSARGECYFINHTKGLVLNLYDDRGMDVVAPKKETLLPLYKTYSEWLLDYDREHINKVFSQI
jgi:hypothetical protein